MEDNLCMITSKGCLNLPFLLDIKVHQYLLILFACIHFALDIEVQQYLLTLLAFLIFFLLCLQIRDALVSFYCKQIDTHVVSVYPDYFSQYMYLFSGCMKLTHTK
jgi:hypothetical protein